LQRIQELLSEFSLLILQWLPENKNKGADNLARQALHKQLKEKKTL
ncbi:ribonuclease HI, partial [Enterococcus faecium]